MIPLKCRFRHDHNSTTWHDGVIIGVAPSGNNHYPSAIILTLHWSIQSVRRIVQVNCELVEVLEPAATSEELVAWITAKRMMLREGA